MQRRPHSQDPVFWQLNWRDELGETRSFRSSRSGSLERSVIDSETKEKECWNALMCHILEGQVTFGSISNIMLLLGSFREELVGPGEGNSKLRR